MKKWIDDMRDICHDFYASMPKPMIEVLIFWLMLGVTIAVFGCSQDNPVATEPSNDLLGGWAYVMDSTVRVALLEDGSPLEVHDRHILIMEAAGGDSGTYSFTRTIRAMPPNTVLELDTRLAETNGRYHLLGRAADLSYQYSMLEDYALVRNVRTGEIFTFEDTNPFTMNVIVFPSWGISLWGSEWIRIPVIEAKSAYVFAHPKLDADW